MVANESSSMSWERRRKLHLVAGGGLGSAPGADALTPFVFIQDLHHGRIQMKSLTNKWYEEVRQGPSGSEDDEQELL